MEKKYLAEILIDKIVRSKSQDSSLKYYLEYGTQTHWNKENSWQLFHSMKLLKEPNEENTQFDISYECEIIQMSVLSALKTMSKFDQNMLSRLFGHCKYNRHW